MFTKNDMLHKTKYSLIDLEPNKNNFSKLKQELGEELTMKFAANVACLISSDTEARASLLSFDDFDSNSIDSVEACIRNKVKDSKICVFLLALLSDGLLNIVASLIKIYSTEELLKIACEEEDLAMCNRSAGQFVTPKSICNLVLATLNPKTEENIADFGCGYGDFLSVACDQTNNNELYGIDINKTCAAFASLRLAINPKSKIWNIELGDMLEKNLTGKFKKIFSNFPLGMRPAFISGEGKYYKMMSLGKGRIGRPASADWIFSMFAYDCLAQGGKAAVITTAGATFNGGDKIARKYFIDNNMIQAAIALPVNVLSNMPSQTVLFVLGNNECDIRMVDASDLGEKGWRITSLGEDEVQEILERLEKDGKHSKSVTKEELAACEYSLFPPRYLSRKIDLENPKPLGELATIERGSSISGKELDRITVDNDTPYKFLRLQDIEDGNINEDLPNLRTLDPKTQKHWIKNGDLIISKNGVRIKVAVADVPEGKNILANGNVYIVRLNTEEVDPYFVAAFLESEDGREIMQRAAVGTAIQNLPVSHLRKILVPVLSKEAQQEVARKYRSKLDEIAVLKIKLAKARQTLSSAYEEASL